MSGNSPKVKKSADKNHLKSMERFAIATDNALGISLYVLRKIASEIGTDHALALKLWKQKYHEAKILASLIADPEQFTEQQLELWLKDFNSWDIVDVVCDNLVSKTKFNWKKARSLTSRKEEFVKRAGFTLMACLAVHDKKADDSKFEKLFPLLIKHSSDERNFVKKAVNWALRNIGKRNTKLNKQALKVAEEILAKDDKSSRWIARDAIRELKSDKVQNRLKQKAKKNNSIRKK